MYADNAKSYGSLDSVRHVLDGNPEARDEIIAKLVSLEKRLQPTTDRNLREDLSGPIVDLLFTTDEVITKKVKNGTQFTFRYSSRIAREFVMSQEALPDHVWEPQTTRSVVSLSEGKSNVIIGGAYFGDHAVFVAQVLARDGTVHCFELHRDNLAMLKHNFKSNNIHNAVVNQEAIWSEDGKRIELSGEDSHGSPGEAANDAHNVFLSRSLDSYAALKGLKHIDVIMLDIEGGEYEALKGAKNLLSLPAETAPALICEIHRAYADWTDGLKKTKLCALMIDHGYEVFAIRDYQGHQPMNGSFVELIEIENAVVSGPPHGFNLLAVKSRKRLNPSVFRIVNNVSPKLLFHRDPKIHAPLTSGHEVP